MFRFTAAVALFVAVQSQLDDPPADEVAPEELGGDVFKPWCTVASDCLEGTFPSNVGNDIQCVSGSCVCAGSYEDPGATLGAEFTGWACVAQGEQPPLIDMEFTFAWNDANLDCRRRPPSFDAVLLQEIINFFQMTDFFLSAAYCGSIHFIGRGKTRMAGKTGFSNFFANNNVNPFGAPTVTGERVAIAVRSCNVVAPVASSALLSGLCQPLSCVSGNTLLVSSDITKLSTCEVTPPATPLPGTPQPGESPGVRVVPVSDDGISTAGIFGIAFGTAVFVAAIIAVVAYCVRDKQTVEHHEYPSTQIQINNGPDTEEGDIIV